MSFGEPHLLEALWAVLFLGVLLGYGMIRRTRIMAGFADQAASERLTRGRSPWRRWFKAGCVLCSAVFLALALARPQFGFHWKEIERQGVEIMVALDCSRSMLAGDVKPSRLERAKREIMDLAGMLEGDRIGLTAFAGTAFVQCPLTLDYTALDLFLNVMGPEQMPVGGTDLAAAVDTALSGFDPHSDADKGIILITDGESTTGDPLAAARRAAERGVRIFTVGVGADQGAPVPEKKGGGYARMDDGSIKVSRLDEETLRKMAEITGGSYVRSVTGDMDLDRIYNQGIRKELEAKTLKSGREKVMEERFQWFLGAAVAFLLLDLFTGAGVRARGAAMFLLVFLACAGPARADMKAGVEAYGREKYDAAAREMVQAQIESPDDPTIFYNLGNVYYRQGEFEKARENFAAALERAGEKLRPQVLYNLGNANYRLDKLDEAEKAYERALELAPDDADARRNLELTRQRKQMEQQRQQQQGGESRQGEDQEKSDAGKGSGSKDQAGQDGQSGQDKQDQGSQAGQSGQDKQDQGNQAVQSGQDKQDQGSQAGQSGQDKQDQGSQAGQSGQDKQDQGSQAGQSGQDKSGQGDQKAQAGQGDRSGDSAEQKGEDGSDQQESMGQGSAKSPEGTDTAARQGELKEAPGGQGGDQGDQAGERLDGQRPAASQGEPGQAGTGGGQAMRGQADGQGTVQARGVHGDVLNRVKDKPGQAMVPAYGRRTVEKDW